jgi:hypothetical protein
MAHDQQADVRYMERMAWMAACYRTSRFCPTHPRQ